MIDPYKILYIFGTMISAIISLLLFRNSNKQPGALFMGIAAAALAVWNILGYILLSSRSEVLLISSNRLIYLSVLIIAVSFLLFSFHFPRKSSNLKTPETILATLPAVVVAYITVFTDQLIISSNPMLDWTYPVHLGQSYIIYVVVLAMYFIWSFVNLFNKRKISSVLVEKRQLSILIVGNSVMVILGFAISLILPYFGNFGWYWYGPFSAIAFFIIVSYAVFKHHLFNIHVQINELLITILVAGSLTQVIITEPGAARNIALFVFIETIVIGWLLLRSTFALIKRDELVNEMLEAKRDFMRIASHQLKTPLSTIMGTIDIFRNISPSTLSNAQLDGLVKGLDSKVNKLNSVVYDILEAADVGPEGTGANQVYNELTSVRDCLHRLIKGVKPEFEKKGIKLIAVLQDERDPYHVATLPTAISRVISIVLDNSLRYTQAGSVEVTLLKQSGQIAMIFRDTGIGIDEADLSRVFECFARGRNAADIHTDGSGIALFIARKILTRHRNGRINVSSKVGVGTTVEIYLDEWKGGQE